MIFAMKEGKILEFGNHDSLICIDTGFYKKLWDKSEKFYKE